MNWVSPLKLAKYERELHTVSFLKLNSIAQDSKLIILGQESGPGFVLSKDNVKGMCAQVHGFQIWGHIISVIQSQNVSECISQARHAKYSPNSLGDLNPVGRVYQIDDFLKTPTK